MLSENPEIESFSIIVAGKFNPAIFHPVWLGTHNLVSEQEASTAEIRFINADLSSLIFRNSEHDPLGLILHVVPDKLSVESNDIFHMDKALDLAKNLLNLLSHTPVEAVGVNRNQHFRISTAEAWHQLGHRLAPKEGIWADFMEDPGMRSLKMESPIESIGGIETVTVEPSRRIEEGQGIYISSNLCFNVSTKPESETFSTARRAADKLVEGWDYAQEINRKVIRKFSQILSI